MELYKDILELEEIGSDEKSKELSVDEMRHKGVLERHRFLQKEKNELQESIRLSICQCATCGRADRDMYYNKTYNAWWCIECVRAIIEGYANVRVKKVLGEFYCDSDCDFGETFL